MRDQEVFPERRLGKVLVIRDLVNLAEFARSQHEPDADVLAYLERAVALFDQHFTDPGDKYHELARPFYDVALKALGGLEVEWSLGGRQGGLNGQRPKPRRFWVRSVAELRPKLLHELDQIEQKARPLDLHPDPFAPEVRP
jgi:hypothetical protein